MNFISLSIFDVTLAASLLAINAGLSMALRLGLTRQVGIAATRMVVQLVLMGLVLKVLFAEASPWLTTATALIMVLFAGREVMARQKRRLAG